MNARARLVALAPGLALIAVVAAIAGAALAFPSPDDLRLAAVGPIMSFAAELGDAVTAVVLLATWRHIAPHRSMFVLALAFATNALLVLSALLVSHLLPTAPAIVAAPASFGSWLIVMSHAVAAIGALGYVSFRRSDDAIAPSRRFLITSVAGALLLVCVLAALAFVLALRLTPAREGFFAGVGSGVVGPATAALLLVAMVATLRVRAPNVIERALALSLLALALDMIVVPLTHRFSSAFYAARMLLLLGGAFVLVASIRTLIHSRARLREVEDESFKRAGRIRTVWEIASYAARPDGDRFDTILGIATAAIRPGMRMFGSISHLDGDAIVFDATSWRGSTADPGGFAVSVYAGASFPRASLLQNLLEAGGQTMAWNDVGGADERGQLRHTVGLRSFIGTPVVIGRRTYFLAFASPEPMTAEPFEDDDLAYVDVVASFVASGFTQQQQFERIQFQIEHDALTGLENRVQFRKAVRDEIARGRPFTLAFVDLDEFRRVNERHGHQIGDEVLVEVAAALTSVCPTDFIARMSADEYGVLQRNVGDPERTSSELRRYADLFSSAFHTGDRHGTQVLTIAASIGAARFPLDGDTAEDLMRKADVALDVAKAAGGSSVQIFDAPMEAGLADLHLRVAEFSDAIVLDQLAVVYQPTFDLATREITGAEALVRWDHPQRGRLAPAEFIDFAERNGLIAALTRWVFRRVVRDLASTTALRAGVRVYINIAAQMLTDIAFITELSEALRTNERLADQLGIEITETAAMEDVERAVHTIDLVRKWGISVAIDDFGTGYSSLSYLKQLHVDVLKIDRSFVTGLPGDDRDTAVAEMLLNIAARFGYVTLAEGIETEAQLRWLVDHRCTYGQGFLVAMPMSFDALLARMGLSVSLPLLLDR